MDSLARALHDSTEDPGSFEVVFASQFNPLLSRLVRQVWDSEIAVDIAAETLAEAFIRRRRFRGCTDRELVGWINGIASRKLALFYRKHQVEKRALSKLGLEAPSLTEQEHHEVLRRIDEPIMRELVRDGLAALSKTQREALQLRIVDELPYRDLAVRLEISEEAARARVARGLARLRRQLRNHQPLLREFG
jgi:RNA polymerase sigma-70 factor (ECF subfamily)